MALLWQTPGPGCPPWCGDALPCPDPSVGAPPLVMPSANRPLAAGRLGRVAEFEVTSAPFPDAGLDVDLPCGLDPPLPPPLSRRTARGRGWHGADSCGAGGPLDGSFSCVSGGGGGCLCPLPPSCPLRHCGRSLSWLPPRIRPLVPWTASPGVALAALRGGCSLAPNPLSSSLPGHGRCNHPCMPCATATKSVCATFCMPGHEAYCPQLPGAPNRGWPSWPCLQQCATPCRYSRHRQHEGTPRTGH